MAGRPSVLTPEIAAKIEQFLRDGAFIETAVIASGISKTTFYEWMCRGRADEKAGEETNYSAFAQRMEYVLALAEIDLITKLKAEPGQWTRYAWMLERRFKERWAIKKSEPDGRSGQ